MIKRVALASIEIPNRAMPIITNFVLQHYDARNSPQRSSFWMNTPLHAPFQHTHSNDFHVHFCDSGRPSPPHKCNRRFTLARVNFSLNGAGVTILRQAGVQQSEGAAGRAGAAPGVGWRPPGHTRGGLPQGHHVLPGRAGLRTIGDLRVVVHCHPRPRCAAHTPQITGGG